MAVRSASSAGPILRLRLVAGCLLITALAFRQSPGLVARDTKLDLVEAPAQMLARSLHLWEPLGNFGQVQNQAYGYLFPMGPFFALGELMGMPGWVVQRLWWSLLLCLAFTGVVAVCRALRIGNDWTPLVAGLAYALSPRILTTLGPISVEAWPMALAPWVLLPLIKGSTEGSPRRAAALSGVAILAIGGVNAAATLAALPPAVVWLATREWTARTRRLAAWWIGCAGLATAWWVGPLLLLNSYSPPFLDYIEDADVTTWVTSPFEALRGTSHWVAWLADGRGPEWGAGWQLVSEPLLLVDTVLLAALGVAGIGLYRSAARTWLVACLVGGLLLVTAGHVGPLTAPWSGTVHVWLDGPLAPLRNVHKFDPMLRLALVLGVAHLLSVARWRVAPAWRAGVIGVCIIALAGSVAPLITGGIVPRGAFEGVPDHWRQATGWLERASERSGARALLVPGSAFPEYLWGRPNDEPLQALASSPWAVRNQIPLTPTGTIRWLDGVQERLATGQGSPGLAESLGRAGIGYVVVRNDLAYGVAGSVRPVLVHQALERSGGFRLAATFGPLVGGGNRAGAFSDQDLDVPYPAVEVFAVTEPVTRVDMQPIGEARRVIGGPESVLAAADAGWLRGRAVVLGSDAARLRGTGSTILSDDVRRREVFFGGIENNRSATLAATEPRRLDRRARDYLEPRWPQVAAQLDGARSVSASSSGSDPLAPGGARPEQQPWSAVDGDPATFWSARRSAAARGQWWQLQLDRPRAMSGLELVLYGEHGGPRVARIRVQVGSATRELAVRHGRAIVEGLPDTPADRVRITFTRVFAGARAGAVGLREVIVPGLRVTRPLVVGHPVRGGDWLTFRAPGAVDGCVRYVDRPLCGEGLQRLSEESTGLDREVELTTPATWLPSLVVQPRPGAALDRLLENTATGVVASASSSAVLDPQGGPAAVIDGDLRTGWVARSGDDNPRLELRFPQPRRIEGLKIASDGALAASTPTAVRVTFAGGSRSASVVTGRALFEPFISDRVTVTFPRFNIATSSDPYTGAFELLPVGFSELSVVGPRAAGTNRAPKSGAVTVSCRQGPVLEVGDRRVRFSLQASREAVEQLREITATPCTGDLLTTSAGATRIRITATETLRPVRLSLSSETVVPARSPADTRVDSWAPARRQLVLPARQAPALLRVSENANRGWHASIGGRRLQPVTLDGWQQGWLVPVGDAVRVELTFGPDRPYRLLLGGGALAALALLVLAGYPSRRKSRLPPAAPARVGSAVVVVLTAATCFALAGLPGLLAHFIVQGALGVAGTRWWGAAHIRAVLAVAALVAAGIWVGLDPWPGIDYRGLGSGAQLAAVVAVSLVSTSRPFLFARRGRSRPRSLIAGRSTRT